MRSTSAGGLQQSAAASPPSLDSLYRGLSESMLFTVITASALTAWMAAQYVLYRPEYFRQWTHKRRPKVELINDMRICVYCDLTVAFLGEAAAHNTGADVGKRVPGNIHWSHLRSAIFQILPRIHGIFTQTAGDWKAELFHVKHGEI